jgi:ribosomal protein L23
MTDYSSVLKNPRITEKAGMHSTAGVYVFDISPRATKRDIIRTVQQIYKVTPVKVNVATVPSKIKRSARTGRTGVKKGGRKAYVYLKKGETITF